MIVFLLTVGCKEERRPLPATQNVVQWTVTTGEARRAPNGNFLIDVNLQATISEGWHFYALEQKGGGPTPMSVSVTPTPPYSIGGAVTGPAPVTAEDPNFGVATQTYAGQPTFNVPVDIASAVDSTIPIQLKVRTQACSDRLCLPARTTTLTVSPKA